MKVNEKPAVIAAKIEAADGFDLMIDLRNGKVSKRHTVYSIPCKEIDSDKKGYKKLQLVTGGVAYHHRAKIQDKVAGYRIQNTVIIDGETLKFVAMHEQAVSRLLFTCKDSLANLKQKLPASVKPILQWTEWNAYRTAQQKTLRIRQYKHERFYSDHAKKVSALAANKN